MYQSITMAEYEQLLKNEAVNLLDVRDAALYKTGHLPGAKSFPFANVETGYLGLDSSKEYYIICQTGVRSREVSEFLVGKGFQVTNIIGGTGAYTGQLEI